MCNKSWNIQKKIERENTDELNFQIINYYRRKRSRERRREELERIEKKNRFENADTVSTGKPVRTLSQLIEDGIFKIDELLKLKTKKGFDKRTRALVEVLRAVPEREYGILRELFQDGKVIIEVPSKHLAGSLSRVEKFADAILYLSPELENRPYNYVRKVAAHELSHLLLHSDFSTKKAINLQEAEANLMVCEWGF